MYPTGDAVVDTLLLMVLGLGEAHAVFLLVAVLIGEDNHKVLPGEILLQFVGQTIQCILIGNGAFTGGDDNEHVVFLNVGSQLWQFVPVGHRCIISADIGVAVVDILANQFEGFLAAMKLDATIQLSCKAAQTLQPAMEDRLKFRP